MSTARVFRPLAALAGLALLAGCVAPPAVPAYGPGGAPILGSYCAAGSYQCPIAGAQQVGTPCACPGLGAPSYGSVR